MKYIENPFVKENFICDSSLHIKDIVEQTTSWLTVNPMVGCSLNCAYCFREKWHPEDKPILKYTVFSCFQELINHPLFLADETPISINVSSTDALLPSVKETTFEFIKMLDDKGYKNIFGIVSKLKLKETDIEFIKSLKNVRLIFFVSYAEIPFEIEPVSVKNRIRNLQLLKKHNIPNVLYFRPIVKGWNDSEDKIEKVLIIANKYSLAICIGGLRLSDEIILALEKRNIPVPDMSNIFHPKEMSEELENKILNLYNNLNISIPLFKHTSCAISHVFGIPNYNFLHKNRKLNCLTSCCTPK